MGRLDLFVKKRNALLIAAAQSVIEWYAQPTSDSQVIGELFSQEMMAATFHVRGGVNFPMVFKRQLESTDFPRIQAAVMANWYDKREHLTPQDADRFFHEFAEYTDHEFLFGQEISAGLTRASRLFPASDFATAYHAQRTPWTLHLTLKGSADYVADGVIHSSPNELLLIAPYASLHYKRSARAPSWTHYWTIFQPKRDWLELMDWQMATYGIYRLPLPDEEELNTIRQLFEAMLKLYEKPGQFIQRLLENLLEQVLLRACDATSNEGKQRTDPRILKACKFIEDHISEAISVSDVASHCNISESRIAHLFKERTGQSVKSFQDAVRIQRAKRLLATTSESIAIVGTRVGYEDPAQFSKFFARKLNISPRAFRKTFGDTSKINK